MQEQGLEFQLTPKGTFRQAQKSGLIHNAHVLIDGLDIRNLLSHDYSEEEFESAEKKIRQEVFPAIVEVKQMFLDMLGKQTELF
jgi:hypothetical protein